MNILNLTNYQYLYLALLTLIIMQLSIKIFKDNKIFGAGPKSYRELCKETKYSYGKYSCTTHSHNYYIQLLAETGILGFAFLVISYFSLIIMLIKVIFFF